MITTSPDMVSCQDAVDSGQAGLADRAAAAGDEALPVAVDEVADERIAADVAAPSARRDGIAAWK
jgi:hypothetical protein